MEHTADYYRHEADRLLSIITTLAHDEAARELLELARKYQRLAERLEAKALREPGLSGEVAPA